MFKKIISVITLIVITITAILMIAPTASAAQVNGSAYRYKLVKNVSLNPAEFMGADTDSYYFEGYIELSNGMAGNGQIGYNKDVGSFYVQINKYVVSGASWCLKYDSSGQWWYRDLPSDYVSEWNNYQMYNTYEGDIYITLDGGKEIPGFLVTSGVIEDTIETFYFKVDDGESYKVIQTYTGYITLPDAPEIDGQRFVGWSDGVIGGYAAGDTYNTSAFNSKTLTAIYEPLPIGQCLLTLNVNGEIWRSEYITFGTSAFLPSVSREGYIFTGWYENLLTVDPTYKAGDQITMTEDITLYAGFKRDSSYIDHYYFYVGSDLYSTVDIFTPEDTQITMPDAPEREGYIFKGWSDAKDGSYSYIAGETYEVVDIVGTVFDAVWEEIAYQYTFFVNDEIYETLYVSYFDDTLTLPNAPRLSNYKFNGWSDGVNVYEAGETVSINDLNGRNIIADLTANTYLIHFYNNSDEIVHTVMLEGFGYIEMISQNEASSLVIYGKTLFGWTDGYNTYTVGASVSIDDLFSLDLTPLYNDGSGSGSGSGGTVTPGDHYIFYFYRTNPINSLNYDKQIVYEGERYMIPEFSGIAPQGQHFAYWIHKETGVTYTPGIYIDVRSDAHFIPVFESNVLTFLDTEDGATLTEIYLSDGQTHVTMPICSITRPGYKFIGWTDGTSIFEAGKEYPIGAIKGYDLFTEWKEIGGSEDEEGERNFLTGFLFDTFDGLKDALQPLLEFEIPIINISLGHIIIVLLVAVVGWLIVIIVSKIVGAVK